MNPRLDRVELAVLESLLSSCAEEMGVVLMRTAHSPNIKERLDHSCAVFDREGRLVAQAAHIPVHLGSLPRAVEIAREQVAIGPGDVVLLNDPFAGGTHLPDLTTVSGVFIGRSSRADFYLASRAHHADVGGAAPGSMPLAREVYEEGLRIPPLRIVHAGRVVEDVMRLVLANVRTPDERRADLAAQLGAQATGERRLRELAARCGAARLARASAALITIGAQRMRAALRVIPRGTWRFEDVLDDDGLGAGPIPIRVAIARRAGGLRVDFGGTALQTAGPVNAVEAVTRAAVAYAVRCVVGDVPINHGMFQPLDVIAPLGSVVNPRPPAAVAAGNVETSQRIVDVVLGALARALPGRVPAASSGTMNNLLIGGRDPRTGLPFAYYETLAGGHGAGPGWNGEHAMQAHMTNTRNTPVEALEHAYPLRVVATRIRRRSGGRGRWVGGDGIERSLEMLAPARVTVISERRTRGPYGLAGGEAGSTGSNEVIWPRAARLERGSVRGGKGSEPLPGKFVVDFPKGAVLTVASSGGGGHGRAARRRVPR
ncbi:MAG: hydantoinase B/oxoprolinase family protein [Candidatus Eisenbacteria bacterium]|uniref:Hydantoinase B/oxoprolinase family protein n=1 Tax=Eiseniibacteriota bacterium TaxID=2212470 RepID=A0A849SAX4_UNCEI|nr:hydantoinase B/oxoprolinase family protein [Candidatus Eisenbacteria bacterium]